MTVELKPVGVACNLACAYCYEKPLRAAAAGGQPCNVKAMLATANGCGARISVFGGEALLTPKPILEAIFQAGLELHKKYPTDGSPNGIQTNGTLIDDEHVAMFKKYGVGVGVSIDGPGVLNRLRRTATGENPALLVLKNIKRLRAGEVAVSVISVMHRLNAKGRALDRFKRFGAWLLEVGVPNVNCHFMQNAPDAADYALSAKEEETAFLDLALWLEGNPRLRWQPFLDVKALLTGDGSKTLCHFNACDPFHTRAVWSVEPDGTLTNCARLAQAGTNWVKADSYGTERQTILASTDQERRGCKGCRFFRLCTGGCPAEAIDGDWRNRTSHCVTLKGLFRFYEDRMLDQGLQLSTLQSDAGNRTGAGHVDGHGDKAHGDIPHGDKPHGDAGA